MTVMQDSPKSAPRRWTDKFLPMRALNRGISRGGKRKGKKTPVSAGSVGSGSPLNHVADRNSSLGDEDEIEYTPQVPAETTWSEGHTCVMNSLQMLYLVGNG